MRPVYAPLRWIVPATVFVLVISTAAFAGDGVIEINQARALAGGVSSGDLSGFPVTIYASGSYRLTGNLVLPDANTDGIVIVASNVSIDLNGFTIIGPNSCSYSTEDGVTCTANGTGIGIEAASLPSPSNISIRNGTVRGMGNHGVWLQYASNCLVDRVMAYGNGGKGIWVHTGSVTNSAARLNLGDGIYGAWGCVASGNSATRNGADGIQVHSCTANGNTASFNYGDGIQGSGDSAIIGNTVADNKGFGLQLSLTTGYASNVSIYNTLGTVVSGVEIGTNLCDTDTVCP